MDAELKKQWVDALRSGKYRQTKHTLKDEYGHCCLGVYCEIRRPTGWQPRRCRKTDALVYRMDNRQFLPPLDLIWEIDPEFVDEADDPASPITKAHRMNDEGKTFTEIAEWIEENL